MPGPSQQTVLLLQRHCEGLEEDGILGPKTWAAIEKRWGVGTTINDALVRLRQEKTGRSGRAPLLDVRGDPQWAVFLREIRDGARVQSHAAQPVSGPFLPVGVMIHHTGVDDRDKVPPERFIEGRRQLSGPLAQVAVGRDGAAHFITNGRAHHAGAGVHRVLRAVTKELPPVNLNAGEEDDTYGNTHFFGIEIDGATRFADIQLALAADIAAMWCLMFRWTANRVIGHKEWTRRKVDPAFDMNGFRADVAQRLEQVETPKTLSLEERVAELEKKVATLLAQRP